jgi:predicted nucleic-acid-binding Zn-ribbon protein
VKSQHACPRCGAQTVEKRAVGEDSSTTTTVVPLAVVRFIEGLWSPREVYCGNCGYTRQL